MTKPTTYSFLLVALLATDVAASPHGSAFTQVDGVWQRSPDACGTPQVSVANPVALPPPPAVGLRTVYLNKDGGTYKAGGTTDASTNTTQLVSGGTFVIPPINTALFNWPTVAACVKAHFKKFNVRVVETEPTSGDYIEAVVGGDGSELGFGADQLFGIASADNFCGVTERGIAFSFSQTHRQVPRRDDELCATIAHEVGHVIALEHEQLGTDLMSYILISDSTTKAFVDMSSGCGTSPQDPSNCSCGGGSTNSHARLAQFIGLRDTETVPPTLALTAPGREVPPTFDVVVTATDNMAMSDVVVLIDDVEVGNDTEPEGNVYTVTARNVAEGNHTLAVIATDAAGNTAREDASIVVKKNATGETCADNDSCTGGLCAQGTDGNFCTQVCDPGASSCPSGFDCVTASGTSICAPGEGGGCCSSSDSNPGPMALLAFGIGVLLVRRRRA